MRCCGECIWGEGICDGVGAGSTVWPPVKALGLVNVDCDGLGSVGGGLMAWGEPFGCPTVGDGML